MDDAANKIGVKASQLGGWEDGTAFPTIAQLRKAGSVYKRPIAIFFLSTPPAGWDALRDFRRLPGDVYGSESPAVRLAIRTARDRREIALELLAELGEKPAAFDLKATVGDNPTQVAKHIRDHLGIDEPTQFSWKGTYGALNGWRDALESRGVLVFQAQGVKTSEMRGFCLSERPLPVVAANTSDHPIARVFTIMHELVHVVIAESGISDLYLDDPRPPEEQQIEIFCNRVAGEVLVPGAGLLAQPRVGANRSDAWNDEDLFWLAGRYGVSREVILRRLLVLGRTTPAFYSAKRAEWTRQFDSSPSVQSSARPGPVQRMLGSAGRYFVRLVLRSYYQDKITTSDVVDLLGLRTKHFAKLENDVWGRSIMFGEAA